MSQASNNPAAPPAPTAQAPGALTAWLKGGSGATLPPPPANGPAATSSQAEWTPLEIDPSEIQVSWAAGWHPVEIVKAEPYLSEKGNQTLKLAYRCIAGGESGKFRDDYLPISGKGIVKTYRVAESVELRDKETGKVKITDPKQLLGKKLWIEIVMTKDEFQGKEREKDEIAFPNGYRHINAYQLPQQGDLFAEAGQPLPADAAPATPQF